jgi:hypothetical protein
MPYTHFRLIGYEVHSAASSPPNPVLSGWSPGTECPAIARVPVPATLPDDARIRLKRLASVVDLAKTQITAGGRADNANTLKVFLAPEFYFRPPATTGADYTGNTYPVQVSTQMFDALNQMFVAADFADWLFVCGTLMWNTRADPRREPLYFNTAIIVRGGQADTLQVVEKRIPSNIDGLPQPMAPAKFGGPLAGPGYDPTVKLFFEKWSQRKRRIFRVDGVTCGVEVCLDHLDSPNCRVLRRVIVDWDATDPLPLPDVQLHLLPAGGMTIKPSSVAAKVNGYILRNDGLNKAAARAASEMRQVQAWDAPDPLGVAILPSGPSDPRATVTLAAGVAPTMVPIPAGAQRVPAPPPPYPAIPQQQLAFYPVTAVP